MRSKNALNTVRSVALEDRDRRFRERHFLDVAAGVTVEAVRREEQVDRRVVPEQPDLPVVRDRVEVGAGPRDIARKDLEDRAGASFVDEDIDVDVAGAAWFGDVVRERERTPEGVGNIGVAQRGLDRDDAIGQRAHRNGG